MHQNHADHEHMAPEALQLALSRSARALRQQAAQGNYISLDTAASHNQTQAAANPVCIAACAIQIRQTGRCRVDVVYNFGDGTAARQVRLRAFLIPFTNPATFFSGGTTGLVVAGPQADATPSHCNQVLDVDAMGVTASGVRFNGTDLNEATAFAVAAGDRQITTLTTSGTPYDFEQHATIDFFGSPFPIGTWVVLALVLECTAAGDVVSPENGAHGVHSMRIGEDL